jgi:hypothetical protein
MRIFPGRAALSLALAGAVMVSAIAASSASAVVKKLPNGHVVSYQPLRGAHPATPFDSVFGNMDYNGGPVMPSNTDYMILWSPTGFGAYPPQYLQGVEQYFVDLAHDNGGHQNTDSVSTQYNDLTGAFANYDVTFGGALLDFHPYPKSQCPAAHPIVACLTDAQIQQELERFTAAQGLPHDLTHEYFLMTPPHVEGCFDANRKDGFGGCSAGEPKFGVFCAYHENTTISPMMFYADDPFVTGNPGCDDGNHPNGPSDGALEGGLSHEHNESITDPIPNDAWTNGAGTNQGSEIGDQCDGINGPPLGTAPDGAIYNQVINGHFYWYQEEWSNQGHGCLQRYTRSGAEPTATFSVTPGTGLDMTFDATGSTASGGVADFSWQFNDAFAAQTVESTAPTITHTFPAAGAYSTGLTVFGGDGISIGTGGIVTTGHGGFTPAFTFSPASPTAGQPVRFSALTTISNQPVISYLWEFGDGTTGSGASPSHTYAHSGSFRVTAVLFSGVGSAFPGAGAAPVASEAVNVG